MICGGTDGCLGSHGLKKRSNDSILQALEVVRKLLKLIKERKLKYIRHASRHQSNDFMRVAYQGKLEGRNSKDQLYHHQTGKWIQTTGEQL